MHSSGERVYISENDKKAGVAYAFNDGGLELPVIDIGHPAFALEPGEAELMAFVEESVASMERFRSRGSFVGRVVFSLATRKSVLAGIVGGARGTYVRGMGTYMLKLGPDNLGSGWAAPMDRGIAAAFPCLSARLRLRDTARLLADGLLTPLAARPGRPLHLINVAGGVAADSLNALMTIRRTDPAALEGRTIVIHVLDREAEAPAFGQRALTALQERGLPLHGLDASLSYHPYDWAEPSALEELCRSVSVDDAICAASSEGGLFEYASDDDIAANLRAFEEGAPLDAFWVGTYSRVDGYARGINSSSGATVRLRSREEFASVMEGVGWRMAQAVDCPLSVSFRAERAAMPPAHRAG